MAISEDEDPDSIEEEEEYEEVEEEEEIEEEFEEEIEEEEEAIEEAIEEKEDEEKTTKDASNDLESDKHAEDLNLVKPTPGGFGSIPASASKDIIELANNKDTSNTSVLDVQYKHISSEEKAHLDNPIDEKEIMLGKKTPNDDSKQADNSYLDSSGSKNTTTLHVNYEEADEGSMMNLDDMLGKEVSHLHPQTDLKIPEDLNISSMHPPQRRHRSSSPVTTPENLSKRPAVICNFYAQGWCIKGHSCRFLHQKDNDKGLTEPSRQGDVLDGSGSKGETGRARLSSSQELSYSSKLHLQIEQDEYKSIFDQYPKREFINDLPFSRGHSLMTNLAVSDYRYCLSGSSTSSSIHLDNNSIFPLQGCLNSYGLTPLNSKFNSFDKGYYSSGSSFISKNSSSFSKFTNLPKDFPASLRWKVESQVNSWEPSVPFIPSYHYAIAGLSPLVNPYDPLLDSIEPRVTANIVQESEINTNKNVSGHFTKVDCLDIDRSARAHGSSGQSNEEKCLLPKEDKHLSLDNVVASANNDDEVASANNVNGIEQGGNFKYEGDKESVSKESKEMKAFRVALIEYMKDLVRPFWHEGRLSKDAHKTVIKKSVEKVVGSLQAYQIPNGTESINHYLSVSRPKLLKLVEAYVEKYTKA